MTDLDTYVGSTQTQPRECRDRNADDFCIDRRAFSAQKINVPLIELTQAAALRAFGAEEIGNGEPLDWHRQLRSACGGHTCKRWREFRAQRVIITTTSTAEAEEFVHNSFATLRCVQLKMLKGGAIDFVVAKRNTCIAPRTFNATSDSHLGWIEIAGAFRGLELHRTLWNFIWVNRTRSSALGGFDDERARQTSQRPRNHSVNKQDHGE